MTGEDGLQVTDGAGRGLVLETTNLRELGEVVDNQEVGVVCEGKQVGAETLPWAQWDGMREKRFSGLLSTGGIALGTGGDDVLDVGDHAGPEDNLAGTFFGFRSTLMCGVDAGQEIRSEGTRNKELGALVDDVVDDGELVAIWPELTKWFRKSGAFRRPTVAKDF